MIDMKNNNIEDIEYKVRMYHDFTEPYTFDEDLDNIVTHRSYDEYVVHNKKTFYDVLDQFLDAPKKKLTEADIRKDFDAPSRKLSDTKVKVIQAYYNGRLELSKHIYAKLKKIDLSDITYEYPVVMKFKIPFE